VSGWVEVGCNVAELLVQSAKTAVYASYTEHDGDGDLLEHFTEWGLAGDAEVPVLRSWSTTKDRPCRHVVPTKEDARD
jgi:hypothetical protein